MEPTTTVTRTRTTKTRPMALFRATEFRTPDGRTITEDVRKQMFADMEADPEGNGAELEKIINSLVPITFTCVDGPDDPVTDIGRITAFFKKKVKDSKNDEFNHTFILPVRTYDPIQPKTTTKTTTEVSF